MSNAQDDLEPMGHPPPPPQIPEGLIGEWKYDGESRVFLAYFRNRAGVPEQDMKFLLEIMARDDLVVISVGLWDAAFENFPTQKSFEVYLRYQIHRKFRVFTRKKEGGYEEQPQGLPMRAHDYFRYLAMKIDKGEQGKVKRVFNFKDADGKSQEVIVDDVSICMIDCDMPKLLPQVYDQYLTCCKMPDILPGG